MALALLLIGTDGAPSRTIRPSRGKPVVFAVRHPDDPTGQMVAEVADAGLVLTNRSRIHLRVNGTEGSRFELRQGDEIRIGRLEFQVIDIDSALVSRSASGAEQATDLPTLHAAPSPAMEPGPAGQRGISETNDIEIEEPSPVPVAPPPAEQPSESHRRRTRISATRLAAIEAEPKSSGLLSRVSRMTSALTNRGDHKRLEQLEHERSEVLQTAGRLSLSDRSGLWERLAAAVDAHRTAAIPPDALNLADLERWRRLRTRVVELDAEIAALRLSLGLGADAGAVILTEMSESERRARHLRVFETMDRTDTDASDPVTM